MVAIFRLILSGVLLYFSYFETGWATCVILFLILVNIEVAVFIFKKK